MNNLTYEEYTKLMNDNFQSQVPQEEDFKKKTPKPSSKENAKKAREAKLQKLKEKKMLWEMAQKQLKQEKKSKAYSSSSDEEILYINPKKKTVRKTKAKKEEVDKTDLNNKIDTLMKEITELKKGGSKQSEIIEPQKEKEKEKENIKPMIQTAPKTKYYEYPNVIIKDVQLNEYMRNQILKS